MLTLPLPTWHLNQTLTHSFMSKHKRQLHSYNKHKADVLCVYLLRIQFSSNSIPPYPKPPITSLTGADSPSLHRRQQSKHAGIITFLGNNMSFRLSGLFRLYLNLLLKATANELPARLTSPYFLLAIIKVTTHPVTRKFSAQLIQATTKIQAPIPDHSYHMKASNWA